VEQLPGALCQPGHRQSGGTEAASQCRFEPATAIVDFTGSPRFGAWLERNCAGRLVFTETAGCNSVVIESTGDLQATASAIAHSLCQASAQMCTSVLNIHVSARGILAGGERFGFEADALSRGSAHDHYRVHRGQPAGGIELAHLGDDRRQRGLAVARRRVGAEELRRAAATHLAHLPP
jgi:hypothetical protein